MKQNSLIILFAALLIALWSSCDSGSGSNGKTNKETLIEQISELEQKLHDTEAENPKLNHVEALEVVKLYKQFADSFPKDETTPKYLFKGGEVSIGLGQYPLAVQFFERINKNYPDYTKAPDCIYLVGFVYDEYLNNEERAKDAYEKVIKEYPDHRFAQDARAAINNLGKSDEELIEMFKEKELQQDSLAKEVI